MMVGCGFGMLVTITIELITKPEQPAYSVLALVALSVLVFGLWYARARHHAGGSPGTD